MIDMYKGARIIVQDWLKVQPDDVIHFICDETGLKEAKVFEKATNDFGAVAKISVMNSIDIQKGDCIEEMRNIMSYATSIVGMTNESFITTNAVKYALSHGARFLSLPLSTNDGTSLIENDFIQMSPSKAYRMGKPMQKALSVADTVSIKTKLGTDITFGVNGRTAGIFNGEAKRSGVCASASFEVYIAPEETKTNGVVVLDGSMGYLGVVEKPVHIEFTDGYVSYIEDSLDGRKLKEWFQHFNDPEMYCAAELGIGLNELSRCIGASYIEDESTFHTFHIGMGRNIALGGKHNAKGHFDIVTFNPTIMTEKDVIMMDGNPVK